MNERILELLYKSTVPADQVPHHMESKGLIVPDEKLDVARFAELIVRECAKVASKVVVEHEGVDFGLVEACYEHFGVEE
jgi:hypothetical protein